MRSILALLLLFGAGIGVTATYTCNLFELPTAEQGSCERTIEYQARDPNQALATCLEYFPTTFVKGEVTAAGTTKCIVTAAYQCVEPDTFLIFDKCYKFPKKSGDYVEGTIADYLDENRKTEFCGDGELSVFYSYTHAKFVGIEAHRRKIDKLWIGIDSDGKEIAGDKNMMLSKMWNLVEGDYWDGEELKKILPKMDNGKVQEDKDGNEIPDLSNSPYYFMRTRTDHVQNRWQGHFERASKTVKATFACEFPSVYTANQAWYCDKLPILGFDAVYDNAKKPHRCLYLSPISYTFKGDNRDVAVSEMGNIKGCQERPSEYHSAGMDDGTATADKYAKFKHNGKLRIAAHVVSKRVMAIEQQYEHNFDLPKCNQNKIEDAKYKNLMQMWKFLTHDGKVQNAAASTLYWDTNNPKNECSDFPGQSTSIGIKQGKIIDMPPEVRAPAICSLMFFQECENFKPCGKLQCRNTEKYNVDTGSKSRSSGFFECHCPGDDNPSTVPSYSGATTKMQPFKKEKDGSGVYSCKWTGPDNACAWLHYHEKHTAGQERDRYMLKGQEVQWCINSNGQKGWCTNTKESGNQQGTQGFYYQEDGLDRMIVREGCSVTVMSHRNWDHPNFELIRAEYGDNKVPCPYDGSLQGLWFGMGASWIKPCVCT